MPISSVKTLKESNAGRRLRKIMPAYYLVFPAILFIGMMMIYPIFQTFYFSVSKVQLPQFQTTFVGFSNFEKILSDPETFMLFIRTITWIVGTVALRLILGLAAALTFHAKVKGTIWMRVIAVLPWTIPSVVAANLWRWIVQTDSGVLNQTLRSWGLGDWALNWLASPDTAMATVIVAYSWAGYPFVMLLILARLQGIPEDLYEAAKLDGASTWQLFRFITLPMLGGVLLIATILEIVSAINSFDTLVIMTGGGPARATQIWGLEIYKSGFGEFNLGKASAYSVLLFIGIVAIFIFYSIVDSKLKAREESLEK